MATSRRDALPQPSLQEATWWGLEEGGGLCQERLPTHVRGQQLWAALEGLVYDQLLCRPGLKGSRLGGQAPSRNQAPA